MSDLSLSYTCHFNWKYVIEKAIHQLDDCCKQCESPRDLPSNPYNSKHLRRRYALFRVDQLLDKADSPKARMFSLWSIGTDFSTLDAKDALVKSLPESNRFMPATRLLSWDCVSEDDIGELPSNPALLKASLGSGGDGIYFVKTKRQILEVMMDQACRAKASEGFIDSLINQYGEVPRWNLQQYIRTLCVRGNTRKTQFRVYAISCMGHVYVYSNPEVRLPEWDVDLECIFSGLGGSEVSARPYNSERNKALTERSTVEEVQELRKVKCTLVDHASEMLIELRPVIDAARQIGVDSSLLDVPSSNVSCLDQADERLLIEMAIVGIDLIIDRDDLRPYVVEFNNNPAMPKTTANMTESYKEHLICFARDILKLGLSQGSDIGDFKLLW